MFDQFNRHINYLRISVTDRCNLRCRYCMPEDGVQLLDHSQILTFEEIVEVTSEAVGLGVDKVRLTGGEPLVRKGIVQLVAMLSRIKGIRDLSMTTNGLLLEKFAQPLANAGLQRINISLDTVNPMKYRLLTRTGELADVFKGIAAAKNAGLVPIKVNCVIEKSADEPDAKQVAEYCQQHGLDARFIHKMDLHTGEFYQVEGGIGGNCSLCNRLRLTANGMIKPCLFSEQDYDVRKLGAKNALLAALENKPACGTINQNGRFYNIGG